jgi:type II secretory pathway pseudopilin PulG
VVLVIATIVFLQYQSSVRSTEEATLRGQLFQMRDALDEYQAKTGTCPESLSQLVAGNIHSAPPSRPIDEIVGDVEVHADAR